MVFLVLAMGTVLTFAMTIAQIPQALAASLVEVAHNKYLFLLLVQILFFLIGMFMDSLPALIILIPILTPIAVTLSVEPIHFGILVEANVALAMAHPPAGVCLFAACAVSKLPLERVVRPILPFIGVLIVTLLMITYCEDFAMFLPRVLGLLD